MIYFVTSRKELYTSLQIDEEDILFIENPFEFIEWTANKEMLQLDTETNMVDNTAMQHVERKLYVTQFGDIEGEDQYVFDMIGLSHNWTTAVKTCLESDITFIGHNIKFEYLVIKSNLGVSLENVHDTFLMSKVANTGLDLAPGYHSLAGCLKRFFDIELDKEEQTTFTGEVLTESQIRYAASDTVSLYKLFVKLKKILESWNLYTLYDKIEREVLKVYSDMELTPMRIDMDYWDKLSQSFIEEASDIKDTLDGIVMKDVKLVHELKTCEKVFGQCLIQPRNEYKINWASTTFKRNIFKLVAPDLPEDVKTKPQLKKFLKEENKLPLTQTNMLDLYMARSYDKLNEILINDHTDYLEDQGYYVRENTILINWASSAHKLFVFQFYYPKLEDTNSKSLIRIKKNELINEFKKWTKANKNVTSYGKGFAKKYVTNDNTIAPFGLQQILATGRVSFGILLQIPGNNRFRNAFLPPGKDDVFVDTDYSSMEVLIMAHAAQETPFLDAIREGKDLHSMSASLLFADEWKKVAEDGCEHLKSGKRCKCEEHGKLRTFSKAITFGLAYGMSAFGLAERLDISKEDAQNMLEKFFKTFPKLKIMFDKNEAFAIQNNYIRGLSPIGRIRFFFHPANGGEESAIGRQGKNFPIQEYNASILKVALIKLRKKIKEDNLPYKIHLPIHDEILSSCHKDDAEDLMALQEQIMLEVADALIAPGLNKVESKITKMWEK